MSSPIPTDGLRYIVINADCHRNISLFTISPKAFTHSPREYIQMRTIFKQNMADPFHRKLPYIDINPYAVLFGTKKLGKLLEETVRIIFIASSLTH